MQALQRRGGVPRAAPRLRLRLVGAAAGTGSGAAGDAGSDRCGSLDECIEQARHRARKLEDGAVFVPLTTVTSSRPWHTAQEHTPAAGTRSAVHPSTTASTSLKRAPSCPACTATTLPAVPPTHARCPPLLAGYRRSTLSTLRAPLLWHPQAKGFFEAGLHACAEVPEAQERVAEAEECAAGKAYG